jgi:hypothetical protein
MDQDSSGPPNHNHECDSPSPSGVPPLHWHEALHYRIPPARAPIQPIVDSTEVEHVLLAPTRCSGDARRCHLRCMMRRSGRETVMGRKLAAAGRTFSWAWGGRPAGYGPSVRRGTSDKLLRWRRQQARYSLRFCFCHELADASSFFLQGWLGRSDYHGPWGEIRSSWCGICRVPCRLLAWSFQKQQCLHALTIPLLRLYQDYCGMCACYVSMRWLAIGQ